jgi:hypothetical protein
LKARLRFAISVPVTILVYLSPFTRFMRFLPLQNEPEVVLAARWRRGVNLKSLIDSRLRFPISVPVTVLVCLSPFTSFMRILPLENETGSSFGR